MDKNFTVEQLKAALLAIRDKINEPQMSMLRAHYYHRTLSMERIARFGGYEEFQSANLQYGGLCGRIARQLEFVSPGSQTYTIAESVESDVKGDSQWRMDKPVTDALTELAWFPSLSGDAEDDSPPRPRRRKETEGEALTKARIGQGTFRVDVIALWGRCAVTGCALPQILVASHIVPWKDATNEERLDPFNGLLLTPNLDKLFDQFLISFKDNGSMLLSKSLSAEMKTALGVNEHCSLRFVRPAMLSYLGRHRWLYLEAEKSR